VARDGSCWLYGSVASLTNDSAMQSTVWWQSSRATLPPIVGPLPPPGPGPPPAVLGDQAYLQDQALQDVIKARTAQNFGPDFDAAVTADHVPAWVRGSLGGGRCRSWTWREPPASGWCNDSV